jgi:hypothetical protein
MLAVYRTIVATVIIGGGIAGCAADEPAEDEPVGTDSAELGQCDPDRLCACYASCGIAGTDPGQVVRHRFCMTSCRTATWCSLSTKCAER